MTSKTRWILLLLLWLVPATPALAIEPLTNWEVSCQGILRQGDSPREVFSPGGSVRLEVLPQRGDCHYLQADLLVETSAGARSLIRNVEGNGFLVTDTGRIVVIETLKALAVPSTVRILDLSGRDLHSWTIAGLSDPALAQDGSALAFRHAAGVSRVDLLTLAREDYPTLARFAVGTGGRLAGTNPGEPNELLVYREGAVQARRPVAFRPRRLAFGPDGSFLLAMGSSRLVQFSLTDPDRPAATWFEAPPGAELRDLRVSAGRVLLGLRRLASGRFSSERIALTADGVVTAREAGPSRPIPWRVAPKRIHEAIPWPLQPNSQHPIGNTYGEYQDYGGSYLHPGVDLMGDVQEPVFAVKAGVVKAVLTTAAELHWRVAVGEAESAPSEGYLYAHLDETTIAVEVGDPVSAGQYLGGLVEWPVYDFTHLHFARIQDVGSEWYGNWLCTDNPHLDFPSQTENEWPIFEPAVGNDLFAFCGNENSNYQDPTALQGAVDIVVHVGDRINTNWVCTAQELRYTIYPAANPSYHIVDDKLAVNFDMALDTYQGGPIDPMLVDLLYKQDTTCQTYGDYDNREFFHVVTNSNGDEVYEIADRYEAWDTSLLPDTGYVIVVRAIDAAGNSSSASMLVHTANDNPTGVSAAEFAGAVGLSCFPNPSAGGTVVSFGLARSTRTTLSVYDLGGRLIRSLWQGDLSGGQHDLAWDGTDAYGKDVAAGTYLFRLETGRESRTEKVILLR